MTELIFIHGTWSSAKIWDSPFAKKLAELVGGAVTIRPFDWSGRNTVSARERATTEFIAFVKRRHSEEPSNRRVVICHSHGGSVAMAAFAREKDLPIDALVCIGTPFIHVSRLAEVVPGALPPFSPIAAVLGIAAVIAVAGAAARIGLAGVQRAASWVHQHPFLTLAWLGAAMVAFAVFVLVMLMRERARDRRLGRAGFMDSEEYVDSLLQEPTDDVWALKKRCRLPTSESVPTLLLKTPGDEAHGFLAAAHVASLFARGLYEVPLRVLGTRGIEDLQVGDAGLLVTALQVLRWSAGFVWRAFVSIPIVIVTAVAFLPFGVEFSRLAGRVLVSAGDAPPGDWRITYLSAFDRYEERIRRIDLYQKARALDDGTDEKLENELKAEWSLATRGIAHSRAYNDLRSAKLIAAWLQEAWSANPASTAASPV